jgi:hypothetical protein
MATHRSEKHPQLTCAEQSPWEVVPSIQKTSEGSATEAVRPGGLLPTTDRSGSSVTIVSLESRSPSFLVFMRVLSMSARPGPALVSELLRAEVI